MAEDVIDHFIDRSGVSGDKEFIVQALRDVYGEFKKLESIKIDLRGATGLGSIAPNVQKAAAGFDSLEKATKTVQERMAQLNGQSKEFTQVLLTQLKAQKEAAQASLLEAKAATESAKAKQAEAKAADQSAKSKASDQKLTEQATNDYLQLSKAYNEAALKAKNYILVLGENHPIAVQAAKDANDIGNVLKKVDATVGQYQRNVGNYKSAFDGLGFSFTQVSRELPALAINFQTFALAISNNLPIVADELAKARREIAALRAEGKETPSLFSRITKSILSPQVGLSALIAGFTLLSGKLFGAGKEAKNFDETLNDVSETIKNVEARIKGLNEQLDFLKKIGSITVDINFGDDFERSRLKAQQASVAIDQQIQNLTDELPKLRSALDIAFDEAQQNISRKGQKLINGRDIFKLPPTLIQDLKKEDQKYVNAVTESFNKLQDAQKKINDLRNDQSVARATLRQLDADKARKDAEDAAKDAEERAKKEKDLADQRLQALTEIKALELQRIIDFNTEIAENENKSLYDRLTALRKAKDASEQLIQLRADTEKKIGQKTAEELSLIEEKKYDNFFRLFRKFNAERRKIQENEKNSQEEYEKDLADKLAKVLEDGYKRFAKAEEERTKKYAEEANKQKEIREKLIEDTRNSYKSLYDELSRLVTDFFTAQEDREISALQDRIDLLESVKQKDIEVVNQTVTNREEAAAQIAIIEARAQAQREQLEKRQRDIEKQRANTEKIGQAATVVGNTAQGVVSLSIKAAEAKAQAAVLASNPLTAALAPIALANAALIAAQIPVIIGIGAAQLARIFLPRYKHGKNVNDLYEGPAVVGDGGKKEAIIRENGDVEITPDKPTLTYVRKRDVVLPDVNQLVDYVIAGHMGGRLAIPHSKSDDRSLHNEIKELKKDVVTAIKNQPKLNLEASEGGLSAMWKYGANTIKYINENTNW